MSHYNKEMVSFYVTTRCNLDCKYCYTNKEDYPEQKIDLDFAKCLLEDYFKTNYKKVVRFFAAGEPTMNLEAIKTILAYANSLTDEEIKVEIQTNGMFDEDTASWLAENVDYIWISCDGTPDVQDFYRPVFQSEKASSSIVEKNIRYLSNHCKEMVGVRMTILNSNLHRQKEMLNYFYGLGVRDVWADPIFPSVGYKEPYEKIDLMEFAKEFVEACNYAEGLGMFYGSNYTCNFDEHVCHYCRACKPVPHATTDGYVTACDMAMFKEQEGSNNEHMNVLIYGKWNPHTKSIEYDERRIDNIRNRNCEHMSHCENCIAKYHCGGYCLGEVTNETGNLYGQLSQKCEVVRYLFTHLSENQKKYKYSHP